MRASARSCVDACPPTTSTSNSGTRCGRQYPEPSAPRRLKETAIRRLELISTAPAACSSWASTRKRRSSSMLSHPPRAGASEGGMATSDRQRDIEWCRARLFDLVGAWDAADGAQRTRLLAGEAIRAHRGTSRPIRRSACRGGAPARLALVLRANCLWSGRQASNPLPQPWQRPVLPRRAWPRSLNRTEAVYRQSPSSSAPAERAIAPWDPGPGQEGRGPSRACAADPDRQPRLVRCSKAETPRPLMPAPSTTSTAITAPRRAIPMVDWLTFARSSNDQ